MKIVLTPDQIARGERREQAQKYAREVIRECQQRGFTVAQFECLVEALEWKRELLRSHIADITKM